ncbi:NAD(P)-dependent oxidoreductase [Rhodopseudomonas sp. BR0C11]|uniref:NAD-dependent epimerase/dehydratase family protein n=1 Tax=Rhodopseudomonas sp. BR0C11 TaxID=2269370 RepID=UPI0013DF17FD|nr:NAD(P)-dependent oxidoreductase [Rhodopseudomonas sp. BR0C11]NEV75674.1 NAD(P)-dependent oxidoreductase [Rhodopseudomonas sp. BR0C11]
MKRALVTGASGFIGSCLVARLLADGWDVHVILRPQSSLALLSDVAARISVQRHSGATEQMLDILAASKPDVVFHLAAQASSDHLPNDVEQMIASNVLLSTQLAEAMMRTGVTRLVTTETFWQHRSGADEYQPVCLYAATKQAARDILRYYVDAGSINVICLVLFDTYGPRDPRKKLVNLLKEVARDGREIKMTPGEQIIDLVHVEDVTSAYLRAADLLIESAHPALRTYAVSSGERMSLRDLVGLIERVCDLSFSIKWGGKPYRLNEVFNPWLGETLPGWRPKIGLAAGLRDVFGG